MKPFDPATIAESNPTPTSAEQATGNSFNWVIILIIVLGAVVLMYPKWKEHRAKQVEAVQVAPPPAATAATPQIPGKVEAEALPQLPMPSASSATQADDPWSKFKKP